MSGRKCPVPTNNARAARHVVIVAYPGITLMDAAGPMQVFTTATDVCPGAYRLTLASVAGGLVMTDTGIAMESRPLHALDDRSIDTVLVAGGDGVFDAMTDPVLPGWLRGHAASVRRTGSTCIGAFLLAAAGLLDGRRATTHWRWAERLQERFPAVRVHSDAIHIEDGNLWTSAGVSAGIDLSLAMVQRDLGHAAALEVARRLVIPLKRAGGQSQFSATLELQTADRHGDFDRLHAWIRSHLDTDLGIERLAEVYGRSTRTFVRHYKAATGTTPAKGVERMRIEAARGLLEESDWSIARIARRCGFDNLETMRRSFLRCLGVPPAEYRARFGRAETGRAAGRGLPVADAARQPAPAADGATTS